jgi:hypothetical protein
MVIYMPKMTVEIDDKLEERFKEAIFKDKGMKRGNIHDAVEEAIELWIEQKVAEKKRK